MFLCLFGISIPIASFQVSLIFLWTLRSLTLLCRQTANYLDDRVPGAGVNTNNVTIGPCLTSVISPLILKSFRTFASKEVFNSAFFLFSASIPGILLSILISRSKEMSNHLTHHEKQLLF